MEKHNKDDIAKDKNKKMERIKMRNKGKSNESKKSNELRKNREEIKREIIMDTLPLMTKRMNYFHQATFSTIHGNFGLVKVNFKKVFLSWSYES